MPPLMNPNGKQPLDLETVRKQLAAAGGRSYWESLERLADTDEFGELMRREFPRHAAEWAGTLDRRSFLKLMAASLALAGLSSCATQPDERIIPYVRAPEEIVPGKPLYFATAFVEDGYALGALVRSDMGRPTKLEGNPNHPASLGATTPAMQASILTMYDPDRSRTVTYRGSIRPWESFVSDLVPALGAQAMLQGAGFRILSGTFTSPTLDAQRRALLARYPKAAWHQYQASTGDGRREGSRLAFGEYAETLFRFDQADLVVSFDADFLNAGPASARYQHDFAARRRVLGGKKEMNRLYALESMPTVTGSMADHRLPVRSVDIPAYVRYVAAALGVPGAGTAPVDDQHRPWLDAMVRDLKQHRGTSLLVAGDSQPAPVHALVHGINQVLGGTGKTLTHVEPVEYAPVDQAASLKDLVDAMNSGAVQLLLILGGNPVFDAPADLGFAEALNKVDLRVRHGLYEDETSSLCHWHLPESHSLEAWGDARAYDGTATIMQPLIAPLFNSKSAPEVLEIFLGNNDRKGYDIVRAYWQGQRGGTAFEEFWKRSLNDGVVPDTAAGPKTVSFTPSRLGDLEQSLPPRDGIEVVFRPDPTIGDGRYVNNAWLQELPKPVSQLTWDNAVFMSLATAQKLGVAKDDVVTVKIGERTVEGPAYPIPGHAHDSLTLHYGYGRARTGKVGGGTGFNVYPARVSTAMGCTGGASVTRTGRQVPLAVRQEQQGMEGRAPARVGTLQEYLANPDFPIGMAPGAPGRETLYYPGYEYDSYAWGMAIDLNACTGCAACTIACQSENNIPVVGKEGVIRNREMHWIRVDQYFTGNLENPQVVSQPLACHHCENAPCEVVCPVGATMHDHEGLNVMVYNRCVGTRYCSNNCPYKVRRFNFFDYTGQYTPEDKMHENPDVTVRSRGVMEKCTYCLQRISHARINAKKENRLIQDGEIVTACQAACPSQAIMFGDINDKTSRVRRWKEEPRSYGLLAELNTRPRTSYLARLKNPNPEIQEEKGA